MSEIPHDLSSALTAGGSGPSDAKRAGSIDMPSTLNPTSFPRVCLATISNPKARDRVSLARTHTVESPLALSQRDRLSTVSVPGR